MAFFPYLHNVTVKNEHETQGDFQVIADTSARLWLSSWWTGQHKMKKLNTGTKIHKD